MSKKAKKCEIDQCVAAFWGLRGVCGGFMVFQDQGQDFGGLFYDHDFLPKSNKINLFATAFYSSTPDTSLTIALSKDQGQAHTFKRSR